MSAPSKLGSSSVDFHRGKTMLKLAQTYPSLQDSILEMAQNAVDAGATRIDITIDRKKRSILIVDNGKGVTRAEFEKALSSVGDSIKTLDKLGRFGLGLISPLGKCRSHSFTSCSSTGNEGYQEWTFTTDDIARQVKSLEIPYRKRPYVFAADPSKARVPPGTQAVNWRTLVRMRDFVEDKFISRIQSAESLKEAIVEKYGVVMRRNDVVVGIHIVNENGSIDKATGKAKRFSGKKLPEITVHNEDAGGTRFQMYLTRKGTFGFKGKVLIGISHDDFRIPFPIFAKEAKGMLSDDLIELFKSGIFEGEIIAEKTQLHDGRKTFVNNDAYVGFCVALENWYLEHGKKHLKEVKEERQGQRIQDLSLRSLQTIEMLLKEPRFEQLRKDLFEGFKHGTVGSGHTSPNDHTVVGTQKDPSVSTQGAGKNRDESEDGRDYENEDPSSEKLGHAPFTVTGPKGQPRTLVKGSSKGLQMDHSSMRADGPLCVLEPGTGTVVFNIEHPEWQAALKAGDRELIQLQEIGVVMMVVQHTLPDEYQKIAELTFGEMVPLLSFLICSSPHFSFKARFKAPKGDTR